MGHYTNGGTVFCHSVSKSRPWDVSVITVSDYGQRQRDRNRWFM